MQWKWQFMLLQGQRYLIIYTVWFCMYQLRQHNEALLPADRVQLCLAFGNFTRPRAPMVGVSSPLYYKYLNTIFVSTKLTILKRTIWFVAALR
jgi:hypothetical protein